VDQGISRRQFLCGDIGNRHPALYPPWFQSEQRFLAYCDQCGDCLTACETGILERGAGGYPQVNFDNGECSFCAACVQACPTGALAQQPGAAPWSLHASINLNPASPAAACCAWCAVNTAPRRRFAFRAPRSPSPHPH